METLKDICKKDGRYKEVVKECYVVKNAVSLLGGRRKREGEREAKEEGEEGEGKGGMKMVEYSMTRREGLEGETSEAAVLRRGEG